MPEIKELQITGHATGRIIKSILISPMESQLTLLMLLNQHQIPIASSCNGEGICLKCKVTIEAKSVLSCQIKVSDCALKNNPLPVGISYL